MTERTGGGYAMTVALLWGAFLLLIPLNPKNWLDISGYYALPLAMALTYAILVIRRGFGREFWWLAFLLASLWLGCMLHPFDRGVALSYGAYFVMFAAVRRAAFSSAQAAWVRACFLLSGLLLALGVFVNWAQYPGGHPLFGMRFTFEAFGHPPKDPNYLAAYLASAAMLALSQTLFGSRRRTRLLGAASFLVMGLAILLTGSRAGMLALGLGFIVSVLARRRGWIALAALALLAGIAALALPKALTARLFQQNYIDSGNQFRLSLWLEGLMRIAERPLLGSGLRYTDLILSAGHATHNTPVAILLQMGLLGGAPLIGLLIGAARRVWGTRLLGMAIAVGLSSLFIDAYPSIALWNAILLIYATCDEAFPSPEDSPKSLSARGGRCHARARQRRPGLHREPYLPCAHTGGPRGDAS